MATYNEQLTAWYKAKAIRGKDPDKYRRVVAMATAVSKNPSYAPEPHKLLFI